MSVTVEVARHSSVAGARLGRWLPEAGVAALVLVAALIGLLAAYQAPASYSVDIAETHSNIELEGVYPPEQNAEFGDYRWTPGLVTIHVRPIGAPLKVQVRLAGWRPDARDNPEVRFTLDGQELARAATTNAMQTVEISLPARVASLSSLNLQMSTPTFRYGNDPRDLGVVLAGVTGSAGPDWPTPSLPNRTPLLQVLLGVLLVYIAGRLAGALRTPAMVLAVCWVILLSLVLFLNRAWFSQWTWVCPVFGLVALAVGAYRQEMARFASACVSAVRSGALPVAQTMEDAVQATAVRPWLAPVLVGAALTITWLQVGSGLLPADNQPYTNFRWGLDFYLRLPLWLQWGGAIAVTLFALPAINRWIRGYAGGWLASIAQRANPYLLLLAAGIVSSVLLRLLQVSRLYGDGPELLAKISQGALWHEREQLDYFIHYQLAHQLAGLGATPQGVYDWLPVVAGGFALAGLVVAGWLLAPQGRRWLVAGFGLATANIILFASGYVGVFTLSTLALVWFYVALFLYLQGSAPSALPALMLAAAMWLHPSMTMLAPTLAAAVFLRNRTWPGRIRDAAVVLTTGLVFSLVVCSIFLAQGYNWDRWMVARGQLGGIDPGTFKPLFEVTGTREYYPIFSWAHLGAIVQEQLLLAPLAAVACVATVLAVRRWGKPITDIALLALAAVSTWLFCITWNPDFGAQKDWDLLSSCGIPIALLAGTMLDRVWPHDDSAEGRQLPPLGYVGSVLVAASAWHALAWVLSNR